jgi:hypothetical protein
LAVLLFLLGMKQGFLYLHPRYQFFDPIRSGLIGNQGIKSGLIGNQGHHALVMLESSVKNADFRLERAYGLP